MDVFEKLNKAFAGWYESLFGDTESDIRPKDVLRKIIAAMEENRKEGLDSRIYVPNKYVLEISFENDEEREYLLAFLEKAELEAALRKYMSQNRYHMRGPLDFTIQEVDRTEGEVPAEKLKVSCRWDVKQVEREQTPDASRYIVPGLAETSGGARVMPEADEEEYTVAGTDIYDAGTVSPPVLFIKEIDGSTDRFVLSKPAITVGRSRRLNNDIAIEKDGMVSKRHASITLTAEGFVIKDLDSTNGVWVNGHKVSQAVLADGDTIRLGSTELLFEEQSSRPKPPVPPSQVVKRAALMIEQGGRWEEFRLPSEVVIGKGLTSDIRLDHPSVAQRHARLFSENGDYFVDDLGSGSGTSVNQTIVHPGAPIELHAGDRIGIGEVNLRFEMD